MYTYSLYSTDAWHTYSSRHLIGTFSSKEKILLILEDKISEDALRELELNNQTQGYEYNYLIEEKELDTYNKDDIHHI